MQWVREQEEAAKEVAVMDHLGVERADVSRETLQSHVVPVRWERDPAFLFWMQNILHAE